MEGDRSV